jgi:hypothetical protein
MISLWSSFADYFASQENPSVPVNSADGKTHEAETLVHEFLDIYGKLKSMKNLKPCDELDGLFKRLVDQCISNRDSEITNQARPEFSRDTAC